MHKIGKCNSCGDDKCRLHHYNGSDSCYSCLGMDKRGIARLEILKEVLGGYKNKLRRNRENNRRSSS